MHLSAILFIAIFLFFVIIFLAIILRKDHMCHSCSECGCDEVISTTTTTIHDHPGYYVSGTLGRQFENSQPFVIDPADHTKIWLNTKDDMYEDAAGKIWKLI